MKRPRYSRDRIKAVLTAVELSTGYRIVPGRYLKSPLGTAPTNSRFCAKTIGFTVLYASPDFACAFTETVLRDRFMNKQRREIEFMEFTDWAWTLLASAPGTMLNLLDLRRNGCLSLGAPTDTVKSRNQAAGQADRPPRCGLRLGFRRDFADRQSQAPRSGRSPRPQRRGRLPRRRPPGSRPQAERGAARRPAAMARHAVSAGRGPGPPDLDISGSLFL